MKILTVEVRFSPEELAEICKKHGASYSYSQFSFACCPFPGAGCPLGGQKSCGETTPEDWEMVLQDEEPEPEFHFGDKVAHLVDFPVKGVFSAYKDSRYSGEAYVLFEDEPECQVVSVKNLKAGWE